MRDRNYVCFVFFFEIACSRQNHLLFLLICETQFKEVYLRTHFNQLFAILMMFLLSSVVCFYSQLPFWYVCTHHGFMYGGNVEKKLARNSQRIANPKQSMWYHLARFRLWMWTIEACLCLNLITVLKAMKVVRVIWSE